MRLLLTSLLVACLPVLGQWISLPVPAEMPTTGSMGPSSSGQSCTLDAAGEKSASVITVPAGCSQITHVLLRTNTVTSSQPLSVAIQTVGADALPTGTDYGGSSPGAIASPAASTYYEVALGTPATATENDVVAVVTQFSGTVGNLQIRAGYGQAHAGYTLCNTGVWNKYSVGPHVHFRCSGDVYPAQTVEPGETGLIQFNTGSATNRYGNRFTLPNPVRVTELFAALYYATGASARLKLLDATFTELAQTRIIDLDQATGTTQFRGHITPTVLPAGTYYVAVEPQTTANVGVYYWYSLSGSYLYQSAYISPQIVQAQRTSGGSWSTTANQVMLVGLVIDRVWSTSGGFASWQ